MKKVVRFLFFILLLLLLGVVVLLRATQPEISIVPDVSYMPSTMPDPSPVASAPPAEPTATPEPTPEPTPTPTPEPTPELFTISVIGDETLTTHQNLSDESPYSYAGRMKGDYSYPFKNTAQYFKNDEFTITNLECSLCDDVIYSAQTFYFRAPTANAQILIEGGIDFVTTANNHSLDFGQAGLISTYNALEEYGIAYGKEDEAQVITTEHGLKIGVYCAYNDFIPSVDKASAAIAEMRAEGRSRLHRCRRRPDFRLPQSLPAAY